jgi:hypothetical protein
MRTDEWLLVISTRLLRCRKHYRPPITALTPRNDGVSNKKNPAAAGFAMIFGMDPGLRRESRFSKLA